MYFAMKRVSDAVAFVALVSVAFTIACGGMEQGGKQTANTNVTEQAAGVGSNDNTKSEAEKKVLWDFRKVDDTKFEKVSKEESDIVLKYLLDADTWDKDLGITSRVSGAFTKANAKETLYFVTGCKDEKGTFVSNMTCGHVGWNSAGWVAIYDGQKPVLKFEEPLGFGVETVTDVNGDGINEILTFGGYAQSGIQTQGMSIGQISAGKYQNIKGFEGYADNCGFGDTLAKDKKKGVALLVSYSPSTGGKMPEFVEEYFTGKCKDDQIDRSSWTKITKKEFDEFYSSNV